MKRLKYYLKSTVKKSIQLSMFHKLKQLQQKNTELNVLKAMKAKEYDDIMDRYEQHQFKLTLIDSADGSTREFRSNRYAALEELNRLDAELHAIEMSLQMLEQMKEETQYEIMMIHKLNGKEVSV